jgi:AcrR family transcriptional regulator
LSPEARRAQLVELGLEMLSTRTLDDLVIEDIAAAAGISRGLLFHYFPSKRDYREAVVRAAAADFLDHIAADPDLPLDRRLRSSVAAFVDYVVTNRDTYVSLVRGASGGDPGVRAIFEETRSTIVALIVEHLAQLAGTEPPERVRLSLRGWIAYAEEVVLDWLAERPADLDQDAVVEMLDRALLALIASAAAAVGHGPPAGGPAPGKPDS